MISCTEKYDMPAMSALIFCNLQTHAVHMTEGSQLVVMQNMHSRELGTSRAWLFWREEDAWYLVPKHN